VRRLKEEGKPKSEITEAVAKLKECKKKLEEQVTYMYIFFINRIYPNTCNN